MSATKKTTKKKKSTKRPKEIQGKIERVENFLRIVEKDIKKGNFLRPDDANDHPILWMLSEVTGSIFSAGYVLGLKTALQILKDKR